MTLHMHRSATANSETRCLKPTSPVPSSSMSASISSRWLLYQSKIQIFWIKYCHEQHDVGPNCQSPIQQTIFRTDSTTRVFSASGGVIMFITMVILCEKCTCLPKPITRYHCHNIILIFVNFSNLTKNGKLNFRSVLVLEKK